MFCIKKSCYLSIIIPLKLLNFRDDEDGEDGQLESFIEDIDIYFSL